MKEEEREVVLREQRSGDDYRFLSVTKHINGDLVFSGQDLGPIVKSWYGTVEYEWYWTVKAKDIPLFKKALGGCKDILTEIEKRFAGDKADDIQQFMDSNGIPYESWYRHGD